MLVESLGGDGWAAEDAAKEDVMNWLPEDRTGQLAMARNWLGVLFPDKGEAWGVPLSQYTALLNLVTAASKALDKAMSETERTPVVTAQCAAAFAELKEKMRFFKKHYFLEPPLTDADLVSLGLKPADTVRTEIPKPDAEPAADIGFPDFHLISIFNIRPRASHSTDPRSDHGVNIHVGIVDGPEPYYIPAPPEKGSSLPYSKFTRRHRERFDFEGCSGKTICISLAYENAKGGTGPFSPVISANIP
jgi:hypothetical protein